MERRRTFTRALVGALICLAGATLVTAQGSSPLPTVVPEDVGMSSERLQRLHAFIGRYVEKGEIPGAVTVVARRGKLVDLKAQGTAMWRPAHRCGRTRCFAWPR